MKRFCTILLFLFAILVKGYGQIPDSVKITIHPVSGFPHVLKVKFSPDSAFINYREGDSIKITLDSLGKLVKGNNPQKTMAVIEANMVYYKDSVSISKFKAADIYKLLKRSYQLSKDTSSNARNKVVIALDTYQTDIVFFKKGHEIKAEAKTIRLLPEVTRMLVAGIFKELIIASKKSPTETRLGYLFFKYSRGYDGGIYQRLSKSK